MTARSSSDIPDPFATADVVMACRDLASALEFFTGEPGFRIDAIFPADAPRLAVMSGYGLRLRLEQGDVATSERPTPGLPPLQPAFHLQRAGQWGVGRAGMQYRDLIPDRLGGRYIASHIRIPEGGPVPDYVHHHHVAFQMIYCCRGWVKVVYEDQGPPFVMHVGDCVLQPPHIRHRVLECSDNMEVIEVGCPAEHETLVDHELNLPTEMLRPDRDFSGQRFLRHQAGEAEWRPGPFEGFEARDTGIGQASAGLATAIVTRPTGESRAARFEHGGELLFVFVLRGSVNLQQPLEAPQGLAGGDSFVVPAGLRVDISDCSEDLELLRVAT
jgi:quercetin dioxygenase-like cupin family protein